MVNTNKKTKKFYSLSVKKKGVLIFGLVFNSFVQSRKYDSSSNLFWNFSYSSIMCAFSASKLTLKLLQ